MPPHAWKVNSASDLVLSLDNFYRYKLRHVASATLRRANIMNTHRAKISVLEIVSIMFWAFPAVTRADWTAQKNTTKE